MFELVDNELRFNSNYVAKLVWKCSPTLRSEVEFALTQELEQQHTSEIEELEADITRIEVEFEAQREELEDKLQEAYDKIEELTNKVLSPWKGV